MGTRSRACHRCSSFCHREECKRRGDLGHFPCHSEGAEQLKNLGCVRGIRDCHVEFTPSRVRFFAALRMTQGEGLAMTPTKLSNATP